MPTSGSVAATIQADRIWRSYVAYLQQLELPHWLIVAGSAFVLFGMLGIILRRARK
jgi:hypothetical protein